MFDAMRVSRSRADASKELMAPLYRVNAPMTVSLRSNGSEADAAKRARTARSNQGLAAASVRRFWLQNGRFSRMALPVGPQPVGRSVPIVMSMSCRYPVSSPQLPAGRTC